MIKNFIPFRPFEYDVGELKRAIWGIEKVFNCELPLSYIDFLYETNGGIIYPGNNIDIKKGYCGSKQMLSVDHFLSVHPLSSYFEFNQRKIHIPEFDSLVTACRRFINVNPGNNAAPIARDQAGNYYLLQLDKTDFGKILFWMKDLSIDECKEIDGFQIADTFDSFLKIMS